MPKERPDRTPARRLHELLQGFDGQWVAIQDSKVVAVNASPYELVAELRRRGLDRASIIRAPAASEPEMVAFG
jgi:hypothetical protein